jgi:hypothetical protein
MNEPVENIEEDMAAEDVSAVWPEAIFAAFGRSVPAGDLWSWLRQDEQKPLLYEIARGFQQSPKALNQPLVRSRLKSHLEHEKAMRANLEKWWCEGLGAQATKVIVVVENEETWQAQQFLMVQQFGRDVVLLAAHFDRRFSLWETENESTQNAPATNAPATNAPAQRDANKAPVRSDDDNRVLDVAQRRAPDESQASPLKSESDALRTRAQNAESSTLQLRRELEKVHQEAKRLQREREKQTHQFARREVEAQKKTDEAQKNAEREARRARGSKKEIEEQSGEIKRLKRLVRQGQMLQEETRRQVALLQTQLDALLQPPTEATEVVPPIETNTKAAPVKPRKPPRQPKPLFGRDEVFLWKIGGREVRVAPREIKERIDRNDEAWVAALSQNVETLRERNEELAKRFLSSVREMGRYYKRVLDGGTTRVLVDASNVARYEKDGRGRGQFQHLISMRDELRRYNCFPILFYADASLPHNIDEPDELQAMARRGELEIVVAGTEADDILAREARQSGARVVTNDRNFHGRVAPDWEPSRIAFHIRDGIVALEGMD